MNALPPPNAVVVTFQASDGRAGDVEECPGVGAVARGRGRTERTPSIWVAAQASRNAVQMQDLPESGGTEILAGVRDGEVVSERWLTRRQLVAPTRTAGRGSEGLRAANGLDRGACARKKIGGAAATDIITADRGSAEGADTELLQIE